MLQKAKQDFPNVHFEQLDLLSEVIPATLPTDFDFIVSAYVLHEFSLTDKAKVLERYAQQLKDTGAFIIGDIAFETVEQRETAKASLKNRWDPEESPWAADEAQPILEKAGFSSEYVQLSSCAGIFSITKK